MVCMGCSSAQYVCAVVVHNLLLAVVLHRFYGVLQFTVCIWAAVAHSLCMGTCSAINMWAVVLHSLIMGCCCAQLVYRLF